MKYTKEEEFLIWLSCFDLTYKKRESILSEAKTIEEYKSKVVDARLKAACTDTFLAMHLAAIEKDNIFCITLVSSNYPKGLLLVDEPPHCLYCKGNAGILKQPAIAIVGTRDCTRYGSMVAEKFAKELCENGFVVVSGLAYGIDTASHNGALAVNGKTIAVLGGGFNYLYPKSNMAIYNQMVKTGLVVSEYLPNSQPRTYNFLYRNRIVVGLSKGVIIPEAGERSGTSQTIEYALNAGVDVFAIPGPITSPASVGTNRLIKSAQGACITCVKDILEHYGVTFEKKKQVSLQLDMDEQAVINALGDEERHIDELIVLTKFDIKKLNSLLTRLECEGLVKKLSGNFYEKTKDII